MFDRREPSFLAFRDENRKWVFFSSSLAQPCLPWMHNCDLIIVLVEERLRDTGGLCRGWGFLLFSHYSILGSLLDSVDTG